jgi:glycosyltransferase involved in cell wall biosynthesis
MIGVDAVTVFAGERPAAEIPSYLLAADLLVSPRSRGTNTPLKIYQYLRSGKPIVATRLLTHTQVLSDETAILTAARAEEFAAGILTGLNEPARAAAIGNDVHRSSPTRSTATRPIWNARGTPAQHCCQRSNPEPL